MSRVTVDRSASGRQECIGCDIRSPTLKILLRPVSDGWKPARPSGRVPLETAIDDDSRGLFGMAARFSRGKIADRLPSQNGTTPVLLLEGRGHVSSIGADGRSASGTLHCKTSPIALRGTFRSTIGSRSMTTPAQRPPQALSSGCSRRSRQHVPHREAQETWCCSAFQPTESIQQRKSRSRASTARRPGTGTGGGHRGIGWWAGSAQGILWRHASEKRHGVHRRRSPGSDAQTASCRSSWPDRRP